MCSLAVFSLLQRENTISSGREHILLCKTCISMAPANTSCGTFSKVSTIIITIKIIRITK
jgi:hypothetical protein